VRLRRLREELGDALVVRWKAFPLRPEPDPSVRFQGTYRAQAWRRCQAMAEPDGIRFEMWSRPDYPNWSVPALEAAHCVARQGPEAFERLHLRLYEAVFTRGINIADRGELLGVVEESGADMTRVREDLASGVARAAVWQDYEDALAGDGVRAIPTVIVEHGPRLTGLVPAAEYRRAIESTLGAAG
jgi:predicted DsbA family dithiol-disulfide isomerase